MSNSQSCLLIQYPIRWSIPFLSFVVAFFTRKWLLWSTWEYNPIMPICLEFYTFWFLHIEENKSKIDSVSSFVNVGESMSSGVHHQSKKDNYLLSWHGVAINQGLEWACICCNGLVKIVFIANEGVYFFEGQDMKGIDESKGSLLYDKLTMYHSLMVETLSSKMSGALIPLWTYVMMAKTF